MKTYGNLFEKIISFKNLELAFKNARKEKTKRDYVILFESNLIKNLLQLQKELKEQTYKPEPLKSFTLRDPKTRVISKSAFRDRIVHHAICNIIESIFDKTFINECCANRIGKGNLYALNLFDKYKRKVTENNTRTAFCLKADIRHYFFEVNQEILLNILRRKIKDEKTIDLINKILKNYHDKEKGMPLGNLTSQFFANVYLNELDQFVKHKLRAKYYIRYVDDFVILQEDRIQLETWKFFINKFLKENLKIELHPEKSRVVPLSRGIDFVGFRNFYYCRLLRKRNIKNMLNKIKSFKEALMSHKKLLESYQGWDAYAKWSNSYKLRKRLSDETKQPSKV
jgi:RNA-directed DNA polymerase